MSTQFVWLGRKSDLNVGVPTIDFTANPASLFPAMTVESSDDAVPVVHHVRPAIVYARANNGVVSFLELIGATFATVAETDPVWGVATFALDCDTALIANLVPNPKFTVLPAAVNPAVKSEPNKRIGHLVGNLEFALVAPAGGADSAGDGGTTFAYSVKLTSYRLRAANGGVEPASEFDPIPVLLEWKNGEVETKVGNNPLVLTSETIVYSVLQGGDSVDVRRNLRNEVVLEVSAKDQGATGDVFGGGFLKKLHFGDLRMQLSTGGVAFVRGRASSPALFSAGFELALIEPEHESTFSGSRSIGIPARDPDDESKPLGVSFEVEFNAAEPETRGSEPYVLFEYLRDKAGGIPALAQRLNLVTDSLSLLPGRLASLNLAKAMKLTSLGGSLQQLVELEDSNISFLVKNARDVLAGAENLIEQAKALATEAIDMPVPLALEVELGKAGKLHLLFVLRFDLWRARLSSKRIYFYAVLDKDAAAQSAATDGPGLQWIDLKTAAVAIPGYRSVPTTTNSEGKTVVRYPTTEDHDGYVDFDSLDLVLDFRRSDGSSGPPIEAAFPGEFSLSADKRAPKPEQLQKRCRLQLERFDPDDWQSTSLAKALMLRIGGRGVSLNLKAIPASTTQIVGEPTDLFTMQLTDRGQGAGRLVVVDSCVVFGKMSGTLEVPALTLRADVDIAVTQAEKKPPVITARVSPRREGPLVDIKSLDLFRIVIDEDGLDVTVMWTRDGEKSRWKIDASVSGYVFLKEGVSAPGGLNSLTSPKTLRFEKVNLLNLHKQKGSVSLGGAPPAGNSNGPTHEPPDAINFAILDGRFAVRAARVKIEWDLPIRTVKLTIFKAFFSFTESALAQIAIEPGDLGVEVKLADRSVELMMPSSLGVNVQIGTVRIHAQLGWLRDGIERAMFGRGTVAISGLPEVTASLKIGTGIKSDGRRAFQLMVFGEITRDVDLFGGAVIKRIGLGVAINNRPVGFSASPNAEEILRQLPTLDVADPLAWKFVREPGVFVMIAMRAMIGANRGDAKTLNAYLLELLVTLDTNLNAVAAGKLWLFSSPQFVSQPNNSNRPAAVAASVLQLRQKTFSLIAESRQNPAFEQGGQLAKLFDRGFVRLSTFISTELADFYLERVSYADNFLGVNVEVSGQFRIAVGRFGMLTRASLLFTGKYENEFSVPPWGGFAISGQLQVKAEFAGLVVRSGFASYAIVDVAFQLNVNGYLYLPGISWQTKHFRTVIPAIVITVYVLKRKKWRVKWEKRRVTVSEERVIEFDVKVPVPVIEKKFSGPVQLEVSFNGGAAFDESGRIGFNGSAAVTLRVLGVTRRLSASLAFQPGVVQEVRHRVAAIESELNRLRNLPPLASLIAEGAAPAPIQRWYYLKRRHGDVAYHVWIPAPGSHWFVPRHGNLEQYANQPRRWPAHVEGAIDPDDPARQEIPANDDERRDASPFRDMVTRLLIETPRVREWTLDLHNITDADIPPDGVFITFTVTDGPSNWKVSKPPAGPGESIRKRGVVPFNVSLDTEGHVMKFKTEVVAKLHDGTPLTVTVREENRDHSLPPAVLMWSTPPHMVELAMPWDRYNYDAIQGDQPERIKALGEHLARIETMLLATATASDGPALNKVLSQLPTAPRFVSDPRWEAAGSLFLVPEAAALPPHVLSADFRPAAEVVALGGRITPAEHDDVLDRLRLYAFLRAQAVRNELHEAADPDDVERVRQARAEILHQIVAETDSPDAPELFGEIKGLVLEAESEGEDRGNIISMPRRRRLPVLVKVNATFPLTLDMLQNATELPELLPFVAVPGTAIELTVAIEGTTDVAVGTVKLVVPEEGKSLEEALTSANVQFTPLPITAPPISEEGLSVEFAVVLTLPADVVAATPEVGELKKIRVPCRAMEPPPDPARSLIRQVGVVLTTVADDTFDPVATKLRIFRRDDGPLETEMLKVETKSVRDLVDGAIASRPLAELIEPLKVHQRFLPPKGLRLALDTGARRPAEPAEVDGAVQLILPVRLQEAFVQDVLPIVSHFIVYRIIGSEAPEVIAERAELVLQDVKHQGTDYLIFGGVLTSDLLLVERKRSPRFYAVARTPDGSIVPGRRLPITSDSTRIRYAAQPVYYGDDPALDLDRGRAPLFWEETLAHVPPEARPLPEISVAVQAVDLRRVGTGGSHLLPFQIVARTDATDDAPNVNGDARPTLPSFNELQFFVESPALESTGYYGDEPHDRSLFMAPADRAADVDLQTVAPTSTTLDKSPLHFKLDENGRPSFDVTTLAPGRAYRLFACFADQDAPDVPRPVSAIDVRLERQDIDPMAKTGRRVDQLEIISEADWEHARRRNDVEDDFLTTGEFTAVRLSVNAGRTEEGNPLFARGIQFSCQVGSGSGAPEGGLEVIVQDEHESALVWRLDNEVIADKIYRNEAVPLRNVSRWTIPERLPVVPAALHPAGSPLDALIGLNAALYLHADQSNPLLTRFLAAKAKMKKDLPDFVDRTAAAPATIKVNWAQLHNTLTDWLAVVEDHRRSPLSDAGARQKSLREAMPRLARAVLTGVAFSNVPVGPPDGNLEANLRELVELLPALLKSNIREQSVGQDRASLAHFGRLLKLEDAAREAAGILLRRLAIADEMFSPDPGGLQSIPLAFDQRKDDAWSKESLPRRAALIAACVKAAEAAGKVASGEATPPELHEQVAKLFKLIGFDPTVPTSLANDGAACAAAKQLVTLVDEFSESAGLIPLNNQGEETVADYLQGPVGKRLSRIVPQAAGLTAAVNAVRNDLAARGMKLVRRPHRHGPAGDESTAAQASDPTSGPDVVQMVDLMPQLFVHNSPLTSATPDPGNEAAPSSSLALRAGVGGLLALLEQLGIAVDVVVVDELGQQATRDELESRLAAQPWSEILNPLQDVPHVPVLVTVREPDGDTFADAGGLATGKLVVLPSALSTLLTGQATEDVETPVGNFTVLAGPAGKFKLGRSAGGIALKANEIIPLEVWESDTSIKLRLKRVAGATFEIDVTPDMQEFPGTVTLNEVVGVSLFAKREKLISVWLAHRGIVLSAAKATAEAQVLINLFEQLRRAVEIAPGQLTSRGTPLLRLLLEERNGVSRTRPVRAQRIRGFWPMTLSSGHVFRIAVRRVSRYTPIVRWALGEDRYQNLRPLSQSIRSSERFSRPVDFLAIQAPLSDLGPLQADGTPSPAQRPQNLTVAPHPTRPGFVFQPPPSAERSILSALSQTRTGFASLDFQFFSQFTEQRLFSPTSGAVVASRPLWTLDAIATRDGNSKIKVAATQEAKLRAPDGNYAFLVSFGSDRTLPLIRAKDPRTLNGDELILNLFESIPVAGATFPVSVLIVHDEKEKLRYVDHCRLSFDAVDDSGFTVTKASLPLPTEKLEWIGKVLRLTGDDHEFVRIITDFDVATQRIEFSPKCDDNYSDAWIFLGETPRKATSLSRAGPQNPLLLRFQQLVVPENLPFVYRYAARFSARYNIESEVIDVSKKNEEGDFNWATRRPTSLGVRAPILRPETEKTFLVRLFLSRLEDHLTPAERISLEAMPPGKTTDLKREPAVPNNDPLKIREIDLPDPRVVYSLFWETALNNAAGTYLERIAEARFQIDPGTGKARMKVSFSMRSGTAGPNARDQTLDVAVWQSAPGAIPIYEVVVPFDTVVDNLGGLDDKSPDAGKQLFLRCERAGFNSSYLTMENEK